MITTNSLQTLLEKSNAVVRYHPIDTLSANERLFILARLQKALNNVANALNVNNLRGMTTTTEEDNTFSSGELLGSLTNLEYEILQSMCQLGLAAKLDESLQTIHNFCRNVNDSHEKQLDFDKLLRPKPIARYIVEDADPEDEQ